MLAPRRFCLSWLPALLVVLLLLSSGLAGVVPVRASAAPTSTITGTVFQDYNANGIKDTSPANDTGMAGVTVTAYAVVASATQQVGQTTSGADGSYTLTTSDAGSGPYRIEFTWNNASGPLAGFNPGPVGSGAGGTVQFVSANGVANLGLVKPADYSQDNPTLIVNALVPADNVIGPNQNEYTLLAVPWSASSTTGQNVSGTEHIGLARASRIGATWGLAYERSSKAIFAAAYMKRFAGFGPGGPGAIYRIDPGPDGAQATGDEQISTFVTLNAGSDPHPTNDNSALWQDPYKWFHDDPAALAGNTNPDSFDAVGKLGLGDIDLSDDGQTLFVVNMYDRKLYAIPVANPTPVPAGVDVPDPANCSVDVRPFATGFYNGKLYVGVVCPGPTNAAVRAYVYAFTPGSPGSFDASPVLDFALTYNRGQVTNMLTGNTANWRAWADDQSGVTEVLDRGNCGFGLPGTNQAAEALYGAQPMLSDIVFDRGDMILGFRDRLADQTGCMAGSDVPNPTPGQPGDNLHFSGFDAGEVLRACLSGTSWTLESAGACGGRTGYSTNNGEGPGSGEYYDDQKTANTPNPSQLHDQNSWGGLAQVPGYASVVMTQEDIHATFIPNGSGGYFPTDYFARGLTWLNNNNGSIVRSYEVGEQPQEWYRGLGKSGGLGDIEALSDAAPIEIGNRVWNDANANGIQDPGELGINGVTVGLYDSSGNLVTCQLPQTANEHVDNFDAVTYAGTNGTVDWSPTPWVEIGDDGDPSCGYVAGTGCTYGDVYVYPFTSIGTGTYRLHVEGPDNGLYRPVNLAGAASAQVRFFYQRFVLKTGASLSVAYTTDPAPTQNSTWTVIGSVEGEDGEYGAGVIDYNYLMANFPLPTTATAIRFLTSSTLVNASLYLDKIEVQVTRAQTVTAQATTSGDGTYTFGACVQPNTAYQVRIATVQNPLADLVLTGANASQPANGNLSATDNHAITDVADSDATLSGANAVIAYTTGGPGANNHGLDFGFSSSPLAVTLASFDATAQSDHILVTWETTSELNNRGFNLYRSTEALGPVERINDALIPSQAPGGSQGFAYTWQDSAVAANTTYYYWLETVDLQGATQRFGPVSVILASPTAVKVTALNASSSAASSTPAGLLVLLATCAGVLVSRAYIRRQVRGG